MDERGNTGDRNTGRRNTGDRNTGDRNTGYYNTGKRNTGSRNTGYYNTGFFNTKSPTRWLIFGKEAELRDEYGNLIIEFPDYFYFDFDPTEEKVEKNLHNQRKKSFDNATKEDVAKTLELPNFDYEIFEEITGITKEDFDKKLGE